MAIFSRYNSHPKYKTEQNKIFKNVLQIINIRRRDLAAQPPVEFCGSISCVKIGGGECSPPAPSPETWNLELPSGRMGGCMECGGVKGRSGKCLWVLSLMWCVYVKQI